MGGFMDLAQALGGPGIQAQAQQAFEKSLTHVQLILQLTNIRICRLPFWGIQHGQMWHGEPGHYWIEIDHDDPDIKESYGWYPANPVAVDPFPKMVEETVGLRDGDAPGVINGDSPKRQAIERGLRPGEDHIAGAGIGNIPFPWDPHHGKIANSVSHPYIEATRAKEDIVARIRSFAAGYAKSSNGLWTYRLDSFGENNCHTFIWRLLYECQLADIDTIDSGIDPHFFSACPPYIGPRGWYGELRVRAQKFSDILVAENAP